MKINALTVCKSLYKCLDKQYSVKNKELFIGLIPFQTIYLLFLQIRKCRTLRVSWRKFFATKTAGAIYFWQLSSLHYKLNLPRAQHCSLLLFFHGLHVCSQINLLASPQIILSRTKAMNQGSLLCRLVIGECIPTNVNVCVPSKTLTAHYLG